MEIAELECIIDRARIDRAIELDLSYRQITYLPESIGSLSDLIHLRLDDNHLTSLPESIGSLSHLQTLDLSYNQLTYLPERIGNLSRLRILDISDNRLSDLPESFGNLSKLEMLCLQRNRLTSIPESICNLARLTWCYLGNSKKPDLLPQSMMNLPELERESAKQLYRSHNQLTKLPASIGNLYKLKVLTLDSNLLASLPEQIGNLKCLEDLELWNNRLIELPVGMGKIESLKFINISGNPIADLSILSRIPTLTTVMFMGVIFRSIHRRYWTELSKWQAEWLLDETNAEIRRLLIQQLGYEKICDSRFERLRQRLNALTLDRWREYTLLKVDGLQPIYNENGDPIGSEPMLFLKMTCPSTGHIHILRVPPEMTSAKAAITWVNHGIHPDDIAIQT